MEPAGKQNDATGPLSMRQTWRPARRAVFSGTCAVIAVGNVVVAALWFRLDGLGLVMRVALLVLHLGIGVVTGWVAWSQSRAYLAADAHGLHVVSPSRTTTYPWQE